MSAASRWALWMGLALTGLAQWLFPYAPATVATNRLYDLANNAGDGLWAPGDWFLAWGWIAVWVLLLVLLPSITIGDPGSRVGRILAVVVASMLALALIAIGLTAVGGADDSTDPDETRLVGWLFVALGTVLVVAAVLVALRLAGWLAVLALPVALAGLVGSGSVLVQNQVDGSVSLLIGAFVLPIGYVVVSLGLVGCLLVWRRRHGSATATTLSAPPSP